MIKYFLFFIFLFSKAFASITVFPTAAHFDLNKSVSTVSVKNASNSVTTYSIEPIFYEVGEDGKFNQVADATASEHSLAKLMRFSPRSITLNPGEEQVVRIMVKKDRRLKAGDYRAHIRFFPTEVKDANLVEKRKNPGMHLEARIAVSIPALLRIEPVKKEINFKEFRIFQDKSGPRYAVEIEKSDNYFPYGEFRITGMDKEGKTLQLALVKGIQAFKKVMSYNFPLTESENLKKSVKATIQYVETFNGQEEKIAEKTISL